MTWLNRINQAEVKKIHWSVKICSCHLSILLTLIGVGNFIGVYVRVGFRAPPNYVCVPEGKLPYFLHHINIHLKCRQKRHFPAKCIQQYQFYFIFHLRGSWALPKKSKLQVHCIKKMPRRLVRPPKKVKISSSS